MKSKRASLTTVLMAAAAVHCAGDRQPGARAAEPPSQPEATRAGSVPDDGTLAETPGDGQITSAILASLAIDGEVNPRDVRVGTTDGIVELEGTVADLLAKWRAGKVAETVRGVRAVSNRLKVDAPERPDAELRKDVLDALAFDAATEPEPVTVEAEGGVVRLRGTVSSWPERAAASFVAAGVRGVREVQNDLVVQPAPSRADAEIAADVKSRLRWDVLVDAGQLEVDVRGGVVTLDGLVGSAAERGRAYDLAWVAGVKGVDATGVEVHVWEGRGQRQRVMPVRPTTDQITTALRDALRLDPRVDASDIDVTVTGNVAILRGRVSNLRAKLAAGSVARHTVGVYGVNNELQVQALDPKEDPRLEAAVERALVTSPATNAYEIDVEVENGVVILRGDVETYFERARAEDLAGRTRGVVGVRNELGVRRPSVGFVYNAYLAPYEPLISAEHALPNTPLKDDRTLRSHIVERLLWSPFVDRGQVRVVVRNGTAELTGTVDSQRARQAAVENAFEAGALSVENRIKLRNE